jgi:hypothetical protein
MSRLKERAARRREQAQQQSETNFWPDLCERIASGQVIPFISNAVVNDNLFDMNNDQVLGFGDHKDNPHGWSIEEQLADAWATEIGYPLPEQHQLPRIALFDRVINSSDDRGAKMRFLTWLKESLLFLAEEDDAVTAETIQELRDDMGQNSFSDVAVSLGYPRPGDNVPNPLTTLARLKLPIYITTSPFDFLEREIRADRREPRTQVCFWSGEPVTYVENSHKPDYNFVPTPENPLVYHIFGLEAYPESVILTEDDYLDFLATISRDTYLEKPLLPLYLRKAMTKSSLILLGYNLRDWDFRILCRGIISPMTASLRPFSLAIQLDPDKSGQNNTAEPIRNYLEKYFHSVNFSVEWDTPEGFVEALRKEWHQWRR